MSIVLFIVGLLLFIGLILVHEWGHFIMARRGGVKVEEFGIFFPPRLYKKRMRGGWDFTINLLPLGGFVRMKGEHDTDTAPGSFGAASLWTKTKIMAAGVVMNLVTALVLLTLVALLGMPKLLDNQFTVKQDTKLVTQKVLLSYVEPGSPADKAGLKIRDEIMDIGLPGNSPVGIDSKQQLPQVARQFAGQTVNIYYVRDGQNKVAKATLLSDQTVQASREKFNKQAAQTRLDCASIQPAKGYLGVVPAEYTVQRSTWSAPVTAVGLAGQFTALTFKGLASAIAGLGKTIAGVMTGNSTARQNGQCAASSQVSGPVGIYFVLKDGSALGYQYMLLIIAIISLTLAIMNILPIPALDGGRLWITLIARGLKRPLSAKAEEMLNLAGFVILITLIILITFVDVRRFF